MFALSRAFGQSVGINPRSRLDMRCHRKRNGGLIVGLLQPLISATESSDLHAVGKDPVI